MLDLSTTNSVVKSGRNARIRLTMSRGTSNRGGRLCLGGEAPKLGDIDVSAVVIMMSLAAWSPGGFVQ